MLNNINKDKIIWVLKAYWRYDNSETVRKWFEKFGTPAPKSLRDKFDATGSILNAPKTGRPKTVHAEENNKQRVAGAYVQSPKNAPE